MTQLETNLNFISSLPDDPTITTPELKQEFDKAGNVIKDFINNTLETEIVESIASCLASAKAYTDSTVGALSFSASNISYDNTTSGMTATNVQAAIDELKSGLASVTSSITNLNKKTGYGDFEISTGSTTVSLSPLQEYTGTITVNKTGFMPIAIAGFNYIHTNADTELLRAELTSRTSGRAVITFKIKNNMETLTTSNQLYFNILWVKVR